MSCQVEIGRSSLGEGRGRQGRPAGAPGSAGHLCSGASESLSTGVTRESDALFCRLPWSRRTSWRGGHLS